MLYAPSVRSAGEHPPLSEAFSHPAQRRMSSGRRVVDVVLHALVSQSYASARLCRQTFICTRMLQARGAAARIGRGFSSRWRGTSYFRSWWPVCCGVICGGDQRCVPTATTLPWWRKSPEARPREPLLCHQLRDLFFTSAHFDFELIAQHNPGRDNSLADALSRDDLPSFFVQVPSADHAPTPVPVALQVRLSKAQPFWKSPDWRDWYSHALAPSTSRTYASAQTRYLHFCSSINIPALPVNEQCLYQFVVLLATQRVAHASLKGYQSALRHLLILSLGADPNISDMVVLHYFLQGIRPPLGLGLPVFAFPLQSTS